MKRSGDPRINAGSISAGSYLLIFLFCNVICGVLLEIYARLHGDGMYPGHRETMEEAVHIALGVGVYILFASTLLFLVIILWRRFVMVRKVGILSDAARKVSAGDYSIRIPPQRRDGKKDEFEVLYEDFNTMTERLGKKAVLGEDFLSNISHEFKTPLSVINNYVTILQSGTLSPEESREYMERIRLASLQLSNMVGDILQISRLEKGKVAVQRTRFDLGDQLVQVILGFDQMLTEKNIEVEAELGEGILIDSDAGLLRIVWNNLLSNAVKFTPEGGMVRVAVFAEGDMVYVSVKDNGCGILPEDLDSIFEKFYQADHSHSTKGNGLGLAMVKNISDLLGCRVEVRSKPGAGAEFILGIPACPPGGGML